ncbi:hypothetical protein Sa4125_25640 [Aureimonas sp. SA4125]|nr:hypothetical protein Sa4125_25640 [Aureimonas sp. SA4125]
MLEGLVNVNIPESYDTVLTVVVVAVVFYCLAFAKDAATHAILDGPIKQQFEAIVAQLSAYQRASGLTRRGFPNWF